MLLIPFIQTLQKAKEETIYIYRMRQYGRTDVVNTLEFIATGKLNTKDQNKY
jgi:hypothetical protein